MSDRNGKGQFVRGNTASPAARFSAEKADEIVTALEAGAVLETAAAYAGVARSTLLDWLRKGRNGERRYKAFVKRVDQALATAEMQDLAFVAQARRENWQAAAWRLERRYPERYGRRTRIDGTVQVTAVPMIDASKLTLEEQEQLLELLRKAAPAQEQLTAEQRPALELLPGGVGEVVDG